MNKYTMTEEQRIRKVKEITDGLQMSIRDLFESDRFKEYLDVMSRFYNYSYRNQVLIADQMPNATYVAGYTSWKRNFGRYVRKGEHGISILAPCPYTEKESRPKVDRETGEVLFDEQGEMINETAEIIKPGYKVVKVFDISQTDGRELPKLAVDQLKGSVEHYAAFFSALCEQSPCSIDFEPMENTTAKGCYIPNENRIVIKENMSEVQTIKTLIHEIAHAKLHGFDTAEKDKSVKEIEAESTAYVICSRYGIDTGDYSFGYVASWSSDKSVKELVDSLETVRKTSCDMIEKIDEKMMCIMGELTQETAIRIGNEGFLELHSRDDGFDYTFYDRNLRLKDGGVITGASSLNDTFRMLIDNAGYGSEKLEFLEYDDFKEKADKRNGLDIKQSIEAKLNRPVAGSTMKQKEQVEVKEGVK